VLSEDGDIVTGALSALAAIRQIRDYQEEQENQEEKQQEQQPLYAYGQAVPEPLLAPSVQVHSKSTIDHLSTKSPAYYDRPDEDVANDGDNGANAIVHDDTALEQGASLLAELASQSNRVGRTLAGPSETTLAIGIRETTSIPALHATQQNAAGSPPTTLHVAQQHAILSPREWECEVCAASFATYADTLAHERSTHGPMAGVNDTEVTLRRDERLRRMADARDRTERDKQAAIDEAVLEAKAHQRALHDKREAEVSCEVQRLKDDHNRNLDDTKTKHEEAVSALGRDHMRSRHELVSQHAEEMRRMRETMANTHTAQLSCAQQEAAAAVEEHARVTAELECECRRMEEDKSRQASHHGGELTEVHEMHRLAVESIHRDHEQKRAAATSTVAATASTNLEIAASRHAFELAEAQAKHNVQLTALRLVEEEMRRTEVSAQRMAASAATKQDQMAKEHATETEQTAARHAENIAAHTLELTAAAEATGALAREEMVRLHDLQLSEVTTTHTSAVAALRRDFDARAVEQCHAFAELEEAADTVQSEATHAAANHAAAIAQITARHEETLVSVHAEYSATHAMELTAAAEAAGDLARKEMARQHDLQLSELATTHTLAMSALRRDFDARAVEQCHAFAELEETADVVQSEAAHTSAQTLRQVVSQMNAVHADEVGQMLKAVEEEKLDGISRCMAAAQAAHDAAVEALGALSSTPTARTLEEFLDVADQVGIAAKAAAFLSFGASSMGDEFGNDDDEDDDGESQDTSESSSAGAAGGDDELYVDDDGGINRINGGDSDEGDDNDDDCNDSSKRESAPTRTPRNNYNNEARALLETQYASVLEKTCMAVAQAVSRHAIATMASEELRHDRIRIEEHALMSAAHSDAAAELTRAHEQRESDKAAQHATTVEEMKSSAAHDMNVAHDEARDIQVAAIAEALEVLAECHDAAFTAAENEWVQTADMEREQRSDKHRDDMTALHADHELSINALEEEHAASRQRTDELHRTHLATAQEAMAEQVNAMEIASLADEETRAAFVVRHEEASRNAMEARVADARARARMEAVNEQTPAMESLSSAWEAKYEDAQRLFVAEKEAAADVHERILAEEREAQESARAAWEAHHTSRVGEVETMLEEEHANRAEANLASAVKTMREEHDAALVAAATGYAEEYSAMVEKHAVQESTWRDGASQELHQTKTDLGRMTRCAVDEAMAKMGEQHGAAMRDLEAKHIDAMSCLEDRMKGQHCTLSEEHTEALEVERLVREGEAERADEAHLRIAQLEEVHELAKQSAVMDADKHMITVSTLKLEHQEVLDGLHTEFEESHQRLGVEHEATVKAVVATATETHAETREAAEGLMAARALDHTEELERALAAERQRITAEHSELLAEVNTAHEEALGVLKREYQDTLCTAVSDHQEQSRKASAISDAAAEQAIAKASEEASTHTLAHAALARDNMRDDHARELEEVQASHSDALAELRSEYNESHVAAEARLVDYATKVESEVSRSMHAAQEMAEVARLRSVEETVKALTDEHNTAIQAILSSEEAAATEASVEAQRKQEQDMHAIRVQSAMEAREANITATLQQERVAALTEAQGTAAISLEALHRHHAQFVETMKAEHTFTIQQMAEDAATQSSDRVAVVGLVVEGMEARLASQEEEHTLALHMARATADGAHNEAIRVLRATLHEEHRAACELLLDTRSKEHTQVQEALLRTMRISSEAAEEMAAAEAAEAAANTAKTIAATAAATANAEVAARMAAETATEAAAEVAAEAASAAAVAATTRSLQAKHTRVLDEATAEHAAALAETIARHQDEARATDMAASEALHRTVDDVREEARQEIEVVAAALVRDHDAALVSLEGVVADLREERLLKQQCERDALAKVQVGWVRRGKRIRCD
jgi:hypothetical protein